MSTARAYAALSAHAPLVPHPIERREPGPRDVVIQIDFCGVCHSDLHQVRDEWGPGSFPMVPGHEIVGRVTHVGPEVSKVRVGDAVGVGCMVDSCVGCAQCEAGHEQFCERGCAFTYNCTEMDRLTPTYGGYSTEIVVTERFVVKIPASLELASAAPLLCAGITTYSPLRRFGCKPGDRVAVVGLGGLGHLAVKLAFAMGAEVTVLSTSRRKEVDAESLGAQGFEVTTEPGVLDKLVQRFDLVLDTVSAPHDYDAYLDTLRPYGTMVLVGIPPLPTPVGAFSLIGGNRTLAGSNIGGMKETQEMLDFCGEHGITADIELIGMQEINEAYERLIKNDVHYRFVVDIASLRR